MALEKACRGCLFMRKKLFWCDPFFSSITFSTYRIYFSLVKRIILLVIKKSAWDGAKDRYLEIEMPKWPCYKSVSTTMYLHNRTMMWTQCQRWFHTGRLIKRAFLNMVMLAQLPNSSWEEPYLALRVNNFQWHILRYILYITLNLFSTYFLQPRIFQIQI